ncbi:MAG TPA: LysR family transcriptional regulator [Solirubrobacteraceae bacterium]|nr:LysR family transcriptional regulator [Solirubrobacteraceae bacterium]
MLQFKSRQLLHFVTVAEEGQITRAAEMLYIAQPALSQSIAQLERELGFKLLDRHSRGVTLTPDGARFYEKARIAVTAAADLTETAASLARAQKGMIEWGFVVAPPALHSPGPLRAFAEARPDIDIRFRELPFPFSPTRSWLAEVDIAVCHAPPADPDVWTLPLYREPRVVVLAGRHRLAERPELTVAEVLDETFIGLHSSVDPVWAGFWSLDDHRGEAPQRVSVDRAANGQEILAALALRDAITTAPASVVGVVTSSLTGIVTIPLRDAQLADVVLAGRRDRESPRVEALLAFLRARLDSDRGGGSAPAPDRALQHAQNDGSEPRAT